MFEIDIERSFSAAHRLKGYHGDCSAIHGHNWNVTVYARARELDNIGIALDFRQLKKGLDDVLAAFDHKDLADLPEFQSVNPTSEALARLIYQRLAAKINNADVKIDRVRVCESPGSGATYFE